MSSPEALLWNDIKETSFQAVRRDLGEDLQEGLRRDPISWTLFKEDQDESKTGLATQASLIVKQDKSSTTEADDKRFLNAQLAFQRSYGKHDDLGRVTCGMDKSQNSRGDGRYRS